MSLPPRACALPHPRRSRSLGITVALLLAGSARAQYDWPANGAPVCNAPGDQHRVFHATSGCSFMQLSWIHSVPGADSLVTSWLGPIPPVGDCASTFGRLDATGVTEASGSQLRNVLIGMVPGCVLQPSGHVWLQGSGAAQQLVVHSPIWYLHERQVADEGDAVRSHPRMAPSGLWSPDTALVVVWSDERMGAPQIRAQRVTWSGSRDWGPSGLLPAPTGAAQWNPEISGLQDGSSLVVWLDARSGGSDVFALRLLPDGSPAPGWPAGGLALESRPEVSSALRIVESVYSGYPGYVVWEESGPRFGGGRSIVARRLRLDGTPDPAWSPLGVALTSSPTADRLQDAALTPAGGISAVWTDTRSATAANPTDLYAQWLESSGVPAVGWPASGLAVCTAPGRQDAARMSVESSYAAFAWEDRRGTDADIYVALRYEDGSPGCCLWQPDGLPATSAPGDQVAPRVGAGNAGGAYVAWVDARDAGTLGLDVYAQVFTGDGRNLDTPPAAPLRAPMLGAPRPNPTRSTSAFTLQLPRASEALVEVIDLLGRRVRTIAMGGFPAGASEIAFDGLDDAGRRLPPAVYRLRVRTGDATESRTLILAR